MSQSDDSMSISSLECDSSNESDIEENPNVKSCLNPIKENHWLVQMLASPLMKNRTKISYYPRFRRGVSKRLFP